MCYVVKICYHLRCCQFCLRGQVFIPKFLLKWSFCIFQNIKSNDNQYFDAYCFQLVRNRGQLWKGYEIDDMKKKKGGELVNAF